MSRRVVITGLGPITGFGLGIEALWEGLVEGRTAIRPITRFDASGFACQVASALEEDAFKIRSIVPKSYRKSTKVMCRDIELAVGASMAAVADAALTTKGTDADADPTIAPARFGCHIGAGLIAADVEELTTALATSRKPDGTFDLENWGARGMENLTPLWLLKYLPNMLACHVTIVHDCQGPSNTITCCEASSALSLGESMRVIQRGAADACLTGGADDKINPMTLIRQEFAQRLATTADPAAVRPFAPDAAGTIVGEGGGILVIEAEETASARGATPYAAVTGFAATQSFCDDTVGLGAEEDGASIADAIHNALRSADAAPDSIDAIVPFGSGIPAIDQAEAAALRATFGDRTNELPIITTIPATGNCAAGNGAVALCTAAKAIREQRLPARLNTQGSALNANASESTNTALGRVLVVTTSQGGQNAAVVLEKA